MALAFNLLKQTNNLCHWLNSHCCKWPNIEQKIEPPGHAEIKQHFIEAKKAFRAPVPLALTSAEEFFTSEVSDSKPTTTNKLI